MGEQKNEFMSQSANRFMKLALEKAQKLELSAQQKEDKKNIDLEFGEFQEILKADRAKLAENLDIAIQAAKEVFAEGVVTLKEKAKSAEEHRVEEYVKAGISKEHIPLTEATTETLDAFATKTIGGISNVLRDTRNYLARKVNGKRR